MDEPDSDQILTIEELRSLRDRMGSEAAAPAPVASAAQFEIPDPPAGVPLEAPADPWEALRRRARGQRRWAGVRWARPLAAMGCLAAAGTGVGLLVFTGHPSSDPPPTVEVFTPVTSAPSVITSAPSVTTTGPASVPSTPEPSIVLPLPITPALSPSADGPAEPPTAAVPPPRATHRYSPPAPAKAPTARPSHAGVPEPGPPPGAAADRAPAPSAATDPPPTLTRTPTSWSPAAPG